MTLKFKEPIKVVEVNDYMVIIVGNGYVDTSSNPGQGILYFTYC